MLRFFHHIGTALLLISFILLLITTITAPVTTDLDMLRVTLTNYTSIRNSSIAFGTFGHCNLDVPPDSTDQDQCSPKSIGYDPKAILAQAYLDINGAAGASDFDQSGFSTNYHVDSSLTRVMILHPICTFLAFVACIFVGLDIGPFRLFAALFAGLAWIVTVIVTATDLVLWIGVRHVVNNNDSGFSAALGAGMWTEVAAMVLLFIGTIIVFFTCCVHRRKNKKNNTSNDYNHNYNNNGVKEKRGLFSRRR